MDPHFQLEYDAFLRSFKRNIDVPHSFLLGAGASISSGIQSAYDCIWEWKKDIYLSKNLNSSEFYKNHKEDAVRKSIQTWLDNEGIYPSADSPEEYSYYADKAYPIPEDRRKYFQHLVEGKEPYIGYKLLCLLAETGIVKSVWSTNFDGLLVRSAHQNKLIPIEVTLDNANAIYRNQSSKELVSIALHGDYKFSTLKNTASELDSQNDTFTDHLSDYHKDKNLIVIGYSGRDKSLMRAIEEAFTRRGSGRLYWCGYGPQIDSSIFDLLTKIRSSGREAYYVATDGFDKTLIHLSKTAFEDNAHYSLRVQQALELSESNNFTKTEFTVNHIKTDKYIKSNLHAVVFPKEVFQFETHELGNDPWDTINILIDNNPNIVAIHYTDKVFALGTISEIGKVFKSFIKGNIKRVPLFKRDIEKVSAFKHLMLKTILKSFVRNNEIDSNGRNLIWVKKSLKTEGEINIHKAVYTSLYFDKNDTFAYLALSPTIHLISSRSISKLEHQELRRSYLEKLFNDKYDDFLEYWNNILFDNNNAKFEFPENSGTGFEFKISAKTAFGEINVLDPNFKTFKPRNYNPKQTQFYGVQLLEPQLIFRNTVSNAESKDYHPMRGLVNNRPFDVNLNGVIHSNHIRLSILCGDRYGNILHTFLSKINNKHTTNNINTDYLIDYPGFQTAFNISLNVPTIDDRDYWMKIDFNTESSLPIHENSIRLTRLITAKIDRISNTAPGSVVVIFIPEEWRQFETFVNDDESFDLHNYIKAYSASIGVSTQLIREETLSDPLKCQIYWWLALSFYVKSLRTPWILKNQENNTAYAGIGYSVSKMKGKSETIVGCSHIYNSDGQGLKYKLSKIDDYVLDKRMNPFLSYKDAFQFGVSIRELFYQSLDKLPERVVVHKRTRFTIDEINGIKASLHMAGIKKIDLVEINYEDDARFLAMSVYSNNLSVDRFPISRGTCIVTNKFQALLWTHGIVPSVKQPNYKYFLGGRNIPVPLKITKHYGDSDINTLATEILGLSKMNWNSFDLYSKLPSTIHSSNQIAKIGKLLSRFEGRTYDYRLFI